MRFTECVNVQDSNAGRTDELEDGSCAEGLPSEAPVFSVEQKVKSPRLCGFGGRDWKERQSECLEIGGCPRGPRD